MSNYSMWLELKIERLILILVTYTSQTCVCNFCVFVWSLVDVVWFLLGKSQIIAHSIVMFVYDMIYKGINQWLSKITSFVEVGMYY